MRINLHSKDVTRTTTVVPEDVAKVLELQTPSGQWRLCKRLYRALGHTPASIPSPPEGAKDEPWATALALIFLRRRPDVIDVTYKAYSLAIPWVNEALLAQAHTRLPPGDLYYPIDEEASRQGRWKEQVEVALEECGYAYFLPPTDDVDADDNDGEARHDPPSSLSPAPTLSASSNNVHVAGESEHLGTRTISSATAPTPCARGRGRHPKTGHRRRAAVDAASRDVVAKSRREVAAAADRETLEQQSRGLFLEMKRAMRAVVKKFRQGDRVESRWRRPTRLDKARIDPSVWHPGRVVRILEDCDKVDVVFEDGDGERLSGIPVNHVRLAPSFSSLRRPPFVGSGTGDDLTSAIAVVEKNGWDPLSSTPIELCSASRRKLAHIASATMSLRCTWEDPVPFDQEMARLRVLGEEKMRGRPEWRGSFPLVDFYARKRLSFGAEETVRTVGQGRGKAARSAPVRNCEPEKRHAQVAARRGCRTRSRTSSSSPSPLKMLRAATVRPKRGEDGCGHGTSRNDRRSCTERISLSLLTPPAALSEAQSKLVAAAVAYDRCLAGARDCLDRGSAAFRQARTYSEQQKAFEESTAKLGPSQPARAGYTDWRGSPVAGVQNATLDVVEAMDAWAMEWVAARGGHICNGRYVNSTSGEQDATKAGAVAAVTITAPPFVWEGLPLVSTIVGHSAKLLAGAPELRDWYGPGFPIARNPFFLAYPVEDRPVTPRNALVRSRVNGEMVMTVSPMLMEEREKEEAALKAIVDKQASAPSWWPSSQGELGGDAHYQRIRRAEKVIAREESQVAKDRESVTRTHNLSDWHQVRELPIENRPK